MSDLKTRLAELEEKAKVLDPQVKPKENKQLIRRLAKMSNKKREENYVTVLLINQNKGVTITQQQIKDQSIVIDGKPVIVTPEHICVYKKKPVVILPSWETTPFSPSEQFNKSLLENSNSVGWRILIEAIERGKLETKKKINMMVLLGILLLLGVGAYVIFNK